jgi:hypothetical protein
MNFKSKDETKIEEEQKMIELKGLWKENIGKSWKDYLNTIKMDFRRENANA